MFEFSRRFQSSATWNSFPPIWLERSEARNSASWISCLPLLERYAPVGCFQSILFRTSSAARLLAFCSMRSCWITTSKP